MRRFNLFIKFKTITAKSPVFSHISATLGGLSTIRAFHAEELLRQEFENHQDLNTGTYFMFLSMYKMKCEPFSIFRISA